MSLVTAGLVKICSWLKHDQNVVERFQKSNYGLLTAKKKDNHRTREGKNMFNLVMSFCKSSNYNVINDISELICL